MRLGTVYQIRYGFEPFFSELVEFQQLLGAGVAPEPVSIFYHLRSVIGTYPGESVECSGVSEVDIQLGNSDVIFQAGIDAVTYYIGTGEILLSVKSTTFISIIYNALGLFFTETQPLELLQADSIRVEGKGLHPSGPLPLGLDRGAVLGIGAPSLRRSSIDFPPYVRGSRELMDSRLGRGRRNWHIDKDRIGMIPISLDAQKGAVVHEKPYLIA